ncbi:hypothetical protein BDV19DRAFT_355370 [Aspergillus venezuelensis]
MSSAKTHMSCVVTPDIDYVKKAITESTREAGVKKSPTLGLALSAVDVTVEITIMILDAIYFASLCEPSAAQDARNLIFEVHDIPRGVDIDWATLVLRLEERLMDETFYCSGELKLRSKLLERLGIMKESFMARLEDKGEVMYLLLLHKTLIDEGVL